MTTRLPDAASLETVLRKLAPATADADLTGSLARAFPGFAFTVAAIGSIPALRCSAPARPYIAHSATGSNEASPSRSCPGPAEILKAAVEPVMPIRVRRPQSGADAERWSDSVHRPCPSHVGRRSRRSRRTPPVERNGSDPVGPPSSQAYGWRRSPAPSTAKASAAAPVREPEGLIPFRTLAIRSTDCADVWFRTGSWRARRAPLVLPLQYVIVALRRHPLRLPTGAVVNWPGNWLEAPGNNAAASTSPLRNGSVPAQTACPNRSLSSMERPRSRPRPEA